MSVLFCIHFNLCVKKVISNHMAVHVCIRPDLNKGPNVDN